MNPRTIFAQKIKRFVEKRNLRKIKNNQALAALISKSTISTGAQSTDYWTLYSYVKKNKPKEILELGPGITTLVLAQALKENGEGRITAMEDIPQYHETTKALIPEDLLSFIDLQLSPPKEYRYGPFVGVTYSEIPKRPYDFVFVDGPTYDPLTQFDADLIRVVADSDIPITAFIDSRTGSCFIYHLLFGNKFKFNYLKRMGIVSGVTKHDLKNYKQVVATAMKKHQFKKWNNFF